MEETADEEQQEEEGTSTSGSITARGRWSLKAAVVEVGRSRSEGDKDSSESSIDSTASHLL